MLTATALVACEGPDGSARAAASPLISASPRASTPPDARVVWAGSPKHGNSDLRMMLIRGARSALRAGQVAETPDGLQALGH